MVLSANFERRNILFFKTITAKTAKIFISRDIAELFFEDGKTEGQGGVLVKIRYHLFGASLICTAFQTDEERDGEKKYRKGGAKCPKSVVFLHKMTS